MLSPDDDTPELRAAFEHIRKPGWGSFEAEMADPLHRRIVSYTAWRLAQAHDTATTRSPAPVQTPGRSSEVLPNFHAGQFDGRFDHKRAAAGDRDE